MKKSFREKKFDFWEKKINMKIKENGKNDFNRI